MKMKKYASKYKAHGTKGWFKDSWRHMLSAKGIKTKYFAIKGGKGIHKVPYGTKVNSEIDYWENMKKLSEKDESLDKKEIHDKLARLKNPQIVSKLEPVSKPRKDKKYTREESLLYKVTGKTKEEREKEIEE